MPSSNRKSSKSPARAAERLIAAARLSETGGVFHPTNIYRHWGAINLSTLEADLTRDGVLPDGIPHLSEQMKAVVKRVRARMAEGQIDLKDSWSKIEQLNNEVAEFFLNHDLLMSPATACRPYDAHLTTPQTIDGRDISETGVEPFGMLANACWNPSISIPAGLTSDGLPVGLQVTARRHRDDILLRLARIHEQAQPWPAILNPPLISFYDPLLSFGLWRWLGVDDADHERVPGLEHVVDG